MTKGVTQDVVGEKSLIISHVYFINPVYYSTDLQGVTSGSIGV